MIGKLIGRVVGEVVKLPKTIANEATKAVDEAVKTVEKEDA